jgi:hypothetical protein
MICGVTRVLMCNTRKTPKICNCLIKNDNIRLRDTTLSRVVDKNEFIEKAKGCAEKIIRKQNTYNFDNFYLSGTYLTNDQIKFGNDADERKAQALQCINQNANPDDLYKEVKTLECCSGWDSHIAENFNQWKDDNFDEVFSKCLEKYEKINAGRYCY